MAVQTAKTPLKEYKETHLGLGAYVTIHCFYPESADMAAISKACWKILSEIAVSMDDHILDSEGDVARINRANGEAVTVSEDVYKVIERSIACSKMTGGAFDITIKPLVDLWKKAGREGKLPEKADIEKARALVDYKKIELLPPNRVRLKVSGMKIDLGGKAKGYACDQIGGVLLKNGIQDFIVDTAGGMYIHGRNSDKPYWTIGIQDPKNEGRIIGTLKLSNKGIATSGNYHRFNMIGGKRYSHIIDPVTGYPQEVVISATVIADSGTTADGFSTAMCILGGKKGISIAQKARAAEVMIIEEDKELKQTVYKTKGFDAFLQ